jgi:hypothetical protein
LKRRRRSGRKWGGCGSRVDEVKRSDSRGLGSRENRGLLMTMNGVNSCLTGVFFICLQQVPIRVSEEEGVGICFSRSRRGRRRRRG